MTDHESDASNGVKVHNVLHVLQNWFYVVNSFENCTLGRLLKHMNTSFGKQHSTIRIKVTHWLFTVHPEWAHLPAAE